MFLFSDSTLHSPSVQRLTVSRYRHHKSGARLDAIVMGNARLVRSHDGALGSFFELDLLKK